MISEKIILNSYKIRFVKVNLQKNNSSEEVSKLECKKIYVHKETDSNY